MSFYTRTETYADSTSATQTEPGLYGYKIVKSEVTKTSTGKPVINLDIELYDATSGKEIGKQIKYVNFFYQEDMGQKKFNALLLTLNIKELTKASDLVGKKGFVLCGMEQSYKEENKTFLAVAFGGFGCWLSSDKKTATAIEKGSESDYMDRMQKLLEKPVHLLNGDDVSIEDWQAYRKTLRKPAMAAAPAAGPETDDDMPF